MRTSCVDTLVHDEASSAGGVSLEPRPTRGDGVERCRIGRGGKGRDGEEVDVRGVFEDHLES